MLKPTDNPLFSETCRAGDAAKLLAPKTVTVGFDAITARTVHRRTLRTNRRELRDLRRRESARQAIAGLTKRNEIYGFTKGQFSLSQLIIAALEHTGPAHLSLATWTAGLPDLQPLAALLQSGTLTGTRWLLDRSLVRRHPQVAAQIREFFGAQNVRSTNNHAKFVVLTNDRWSLVIRTSMNLNHNARFEDFTIANDPAAARFIAAILDEIWRNEQDL